MLRGVAVGKIKPENINLAVVGKQFGNLIAHVFRVFSHIPFFADGFRVRFVAAGVQHINREIRMVPVNQRVVKTDPNALGAKSVHKFPQQVAARGGVGRLVIRIGAVPKAEAFVVLGGQHHVFHAGRFGAARPFFGVEQVRVEMAKVQIVMLFRNFFLGFDPLVARGQAVQPPVDKHAEAVMGKPGRIAGGLFRAVRGHLLYLLRYFSSVEYRPHP